MRKASSTRYWVFRGDLGGRSVAWGTTAVHSSSGAVLPVLLEPPQGLSVGPSLTVGEPPHEVSTSLVLADPEGEIAASILPDRRGRQLLSGRVYVGEIEDGAATETAISPTLHVKGNVTHQDGITTVNLQSDDSHILGASIALWNVLEVLSGNLIDVSYPSRSGIADYLDGRNPNFLVRDARAALKKTQD